SSPTRRSSDLYRRFRGHDDPDKGKGADWEGQLITLDLYDAKSRKVSFVPILFSDRCKEFIPEPLRGVTHYLLDPSDAHSATEYSKVDCLFFMERQVSFLLLWVFHK